MALWHAWYRQDALDVSPYRYQQELPACRLADPPLRSPEPSRRSMDVVGSNPFNALVPFFTNVREAPEYLANTTARVSTDSFYWANRLIAALADARFRDNENAIDAIARRLARLGIS